MQYINERRDCHILTIEDPVEYLYERSKALIHQREIGRDVDSFDTALRSAMREDPDVILVGEMRDYETIAAVVTLAETGHLVFSTLHTIGAAKTINRIIDVISSMIRDNKVHQINSQIQTGAKDGMQTLNFALAKLVRTQKIGLDIAEKYSDDAKELRQYLGM